MKLITALLFLLSSTAAITTYARSSEEQRIWLGLMVQKKLTSSFDLWAESQLRHDETNQTMNQTLNRFGFLRSLTSNHEVGFLFAFVQTGLTKEYRPTLQYTYKSNWKDKLFTIRNRLEGRDIEDNDANSLRFRSLFRLAAPLSNNSALVLWDEPFLNLTHENWTGDRLIERNRIFAGVRIKFDQASLEIGYMNQFVPRKTRDLMEHILTAYLFF